MSDKDDLDELYNKAGSQSTDNNLDYTFWQMYKLIT